MNMHLFTYFDEVFTYARDTSVLANALTLIVLALLATYKPNVLNKLKVYSILIAAALLGGFLLWNSFSYQNTGLLIFASALVSVARALTLAVLMLYVSNFNSKEVPAIIALGLALSLIISQFFTYFDFVSTVGYFTLMPVIIALVLYKLLNLDFITSSEESPVEASILQPQTFVSFQSQVFISILVFQFGFGLSLRLGEIEGVPLFATEISVVVLLLIFIVAVIKHELINVDRLIDTSVVLLFSGLLFVIITLADHQFWATTILQLAYNIFQVAAWLILIRIASKNLYNALGVISWGAALMGLGTILGAQSGLFINRVAEIDFDLVQLITVFIIIIFLIYFIFAFRTFNFEDTIFKVETYKNTEVNTEFINFGERVSEISEMYNLTPRETEIFELLARGRNRKYLEEELGISRNTVKVHVQNIYNKLQVHSHQELIDIVETE